MKKQKPQELPCEGVGYQSKAPINYNHALINKKHINKHVHTHRDADMHTAACTCMYTNSFASLQLLVHAKAVAEMVPTQSYQHPDPALWSVFDLSGN